MSTRVTIGRYAPAVGVFALTMALSCPVFAAIATPTAQKRVLATHAEASSDVAVPVIDNDAAASADLDPYGAVIESHALVGPPVPADGYGQATQLSSFLPGQIHCEGTTQASILTTFIHFPEANRQSYAEASASSTCEFIFTVDESTDWQLSGLLTSNFTGSTADVLLRIDGGATLFSAEADFDNNVELMPFDFSQTLLPGNVYKLTFTSASVASGIGGEEVEDFVINTIGTYNGQLALVPEPTALAMLALFLPFHARRRR